MRTAETYVFSICQEKDGNAVKKGNGPFPFYTQSRSDMDRSPYVYGNSVYAMSVCRTVTATPAPSQSAFMGGATFIMSTVTSLACG